MTAWNYFDDRYGATGLCSSGKFSGERTFCETLAEMRSADAEIRRCRRMNETESRAHAIVNALVFPV
ncbi:MAG TPA: hypothetical protein VGM85_09400 [Paraburkholderia sp.]